MWEELIIKMNNSNTENWCIVGNFNCARMTSWATKSEKERNTRHPFGGKKISYATKK